MANINDDTIDLRRYINSIKKNKWLFVATFVIVMAVGVFFASTREPKYELYSSMLIESEEGGAGSVAAGMLGNMAKTFAFGGFGGSSVDNELFVAKSHTVLVNTIKKLGLNRQYFLKEGFMRKKSLYKDTPILVVTDEHYFDTARTTLQFKIKLNENGSADIKVVKGFTKTYFDKEGLQLPASVETEYGRFMVLASENYEKGEEMSLNVYVKGNETVAEDLAEVLLVDTYDALSDGIVLTYSDANLERGKDILNTMMAEYNEFRLSEKNMKAGKDMDFIDSQLDVMYQSLSQSESALEEFKTENKLSDIPSELAMILESSGRLNELILEAKAQVMMCDLMLNFLAQENNKYSLVPSFDNGGDAGNEIVMQYNELVLKRMRLMRSAKTDNVALQEVSENIDAMRGVVVESVQRFKENCNASLATLEGQNDKFMARLGDAPKLERQYVNLMRDSEMKNSLYLYLLGKKGDYMLQQMSGTMSGSIIDEAYSESTKPSRMTAYIVVGLAFVMSLLMPLVFVIYRLNRKDIAEREWDMPDIIKKNKNYVVVESTDSCIALMKTSGKHNWVFLHTDTSECGENAMNGVKEIAGKLVACGEKVAILDFSRDCTDNGLNSYFAGNELKLQEQGENILYAGFSGNSAVEALSHVRFKQLVEELEKKVGKVCMLVPFVQGNMLAANDIDDCGMTYVVNSGVDKRKVLKRNAVDIEKNQKMIFLVH